MLIRLRSAPIFVTTSAEATARQESYGVTSRRDWWLSVDKKQNLSPGFSRFSFDSLKPQRE
jgi:hypothetical protein